MYKNYYNILGIGKAATKQEIKKAYRVKALQYHPDVNPSPLAKLKFQELHEAYEALYNNRYPKQVGQYTSQTQPKPKAKRYRQRTYSHFEERHTKARGNYKTTHQSTKPRKEGTLSKLGIQVSFGFFYVVRGSAMAMFALPAFVLFFETRVFFSLSTFASLFLGWYLYRYSQDWIRELREDLKSEVYKKP